MTEDRRDSAVTTISMAPVRAFACLGSLSIAYSRSGNGKPLLLLVPGFSLRERLREQLAGHFKVLAPEIGARCGGVRGRLWIPELIEALGLAHPHVVVAGPRTLEALLFGMSEPDQVDRIAILWRDPFTCAGALPTPGSGPPDLSRLLLVLPLAGGTRRDPVRPAEIETLVRFLE